MAVGRRRRLAIIYMLQEKSGRFGELVELGFESDVPVDVIFHDERRCDVLLDNPNHERPRVSSRYSSYSTQTIGGISLCDLCITFIWARQLPILPGDNGPLPLPPAGIVFSRTSTPRTPSANVKRSPEVAPSNVIPSRRSVRSGRFTTKISWNCQRISRLTCVAGSTSKTADRHPARLEENARLVFG